MTAIQQITDSQIINIHRLRFSGLSFRQIRKQTGHSLHVIHDHCEGRISYSPSVAAKIQKYRVSTKPRPRAVPDGMLSIRETTLLIPFNPKPKTILNDVKAGSLKTCKCSGVHATRIDWIDDHIAKRFGNVPDGVAILHNDLDLCLLDDTPPRFVESLPRFLVNNRPASLLFDVNKACTEHGLRIEIPAIVHSRVARALTYGARFVLIHEGMFV